MGKMVDTYKRFITLQISLEEAAKTYGMTPTSLKFRLQRAKRDVVLTLSTLEQYEAGENHASRGVQNPRH